MTSGFRVNEPIDTKETFEYSNEPVGHGSTPNQTSITIKVGNMVSDTVKVKKLDYIYIDWSRPVKNSHIKGIFK